jgi:hypothetical protein
MEPHWLAQAESESDVILSRPIQVETQAVTRCNSTSQPLRLDVTGTVRRRARTTESSRYVPGRVQTYDVVELEQTS